MFMNVRSKSFNTNSSHALMLKDYMYTSEAKSTNCDDWSCLSTMTKPRSVTCWTFSWFLNDGSWRTLNRGGLFRDLIADEFLFRDQEPRTLQVYKFAPAGKFQPNNKVEHFLNGKDRRNITIPNLEKSGGEAVRWRCFQSVAPSCGRSRLHISH